jgi:cytidylate kinase
MSKITIAIDGHSSCGKSTLARALASKLNYTYVDTGAMYRSVALHALHIGAIVNEIISEPMIVSFLPEIKIHFEYNLQHRHSETYLNDRNVEREIRSMEVARVVSKVAAIKEVRTKMVSIQREMGKNKGVVMDGRDIGTNVFPKAELKIFMTADPDVRAQRRVDEMNSKGQHVSFEDVKKNLLKRDYEDSNRKENPLIKADDAVVLDNSELNKEEQLEFVLKLIRDLQLTKDHFSEGN